MFHRTHIIFIIGVSALLSACGGGGSGTSSGPATSPSTFQVRTAWVNNFNDSRTLPYTVSGSVSGTTVVGIGTFSQCCEHSGSFEGAAALQKTETAASTLNGNSITIPLSISTTSYVDSNYVLLGTSGISYAVVTG